MDAYYPYTDYLEHYGILGMKWGIRRTPEQLGHKSKPKTSIERWKAKKVSAIDKVYNKTYKKLDAAIRENPDDKSISDYRKQIEAQHKKDRNQITDMTYSQILQAQGGEAAARKQKAKQAAATAGGAALWTARMALTLTRIGGMALMINIAADAGNTLISALGDEKMQKMINLGSDTILTVGNTSLKTLNAMEKAATTSGNVYIPGADALDKILQRV